MKTQIVKAELVKTEELNAIQLAEKFIRIHKEVVGDVNETILQLGKTLCEMVDQCPDVLNHIVLMNPTLSHNMLGNLQRVGRGECYPELLRDSSPASRKLKFLPASKQKQLYSAPVKIVKHENGKNIVEEKMIQQLTPEETKVFFDGNNQPRSVEEQIKVAQEKPKVKGEQAQRFTVYDDGSVLILPKTLLTLADFQGIYEQAMAKQKAGLQQSMKKNQV